MSFQISSFIALLMLVGFIHCSVTTNAQERQCAVDRLTFANCRVSREQAIDCLFDQFAPSDSPNEIPVEVLRDAWVKLLNDAQRRIAGSVENVINVCNPAHAPSFSRAAMLLNDCSCIENCNWALKVQVVCNIAKLNPNWRDRV
jgi:hypothetical protein